MARLANVLLILATVYVTKCFIHFDGFHYYDKYHLQQLLKLLRDTYADAERELRLIFKNNTLTKQQFHDMINDWALKQSRILFDAIAENLNKIQQQIIQMERIAEESVNISSKEHENLLTVIQIKTNVSLTKPQEIDALKQFMKTLNRTDRMRLNLFLRQNFLKQRDIRSIQKGNDSSASEEFNEISNGHKRSCKILCHSMNSNDIVHLNLNTTLKDEIINMIRNSTDDDQIVMGEMLELFEDSTEYSPILVQVPII
ncbi:hypothetical protein WUBG_01000 [Wuchereria bancrofti]|uniref:SXP/RAL-2 family protein Ani s 5-like cation-binding domain-containing protein n=1 Tax=Wuchereria bancrofti TaxID=6293 RepID=J9FL53_WUCBA|nr:hypothetical protein WUBG_01000 [Wuchereria bancrofti]VDM10094.1 unnamed protein product [Wuchereria bancrofti]